MISLADSYIELRAAYRCAREDEKTSQEADEAEQVVENEEGADASEYLCSCCHLGVVCVWSKLLV